MTSGAATLSCPDQGRRPRQLGAGAIVLVVLASVAGLIGLVGPEGRRITDVATRPAIESNFGQLLTVAAGLIGVAAGLCLIRRWPWLLLAGALAGVPAAVVRIWPTLLHETTWPEKYTAGQDGIIDTLSAGGTMGGALLTTGILGAAQHLARGGARRHAAAVVAAMVGAELFSRILFGRPAPVPGPPPADGAVALLTATGLLGAVLAVLAVATGRLTEPTEHPPDRRLLRLGLIAAAIPLLPKVVGAFFPSDPPALAEVAISGAITLAASTAIAIIAGGGVLLAAVVVSAAALAASAPLFAAYYAMTVAAVPVLPVAATGLVLGVLAATLRHRLLAGAAICLLLGAGAVAAPELTGRGLRGLFQQSEHPPASLVMVLVIVSVVLAAGAVAPGLAERGALPLALGPLFTGLAMAGQDLMFFSGRLSADPTMLGKLYGPQPIALAGFLLLLSAILLLCRGIREQRTATG